MKNELKKANLGDKIIVVVSQENFYFCPNFFGNLQVAHKIWIKDLAALRSYNVIDKAKHWFYSNLPLGAKEVVIDFMLIDDLVPVDIDTLASMITDVVVV